jgi:hypothetical protein
MELQYLTTWGADNGECFIFVKIFSLLGRAESVSLLESFFFFYFLHQSAGASPPTSTSSLIPFVLVFSSLS